jgi:dTDP-4-dehydrorhamnose 3,5-epimerase
MKFTESEIKGVWIIETEPFADHRGYFMPVYEESVFKEHGIESQFTQDSLSLSCKGTVRGLHYQMAPHAQAKLVRVISGEIYDIAVDIRRDSPTFGKWVGCTLSDENRKVLYIPEGFAHGFMALSEQAQVYYKCSGHYAPEADRSIIWNDPTIKIEWPEVPNMDYLSEKDRNAPPLEKADINF